MSVTESPSSGNKKNLIGETIGQQWTLTSRLGRGGIGHVYEALHSDGKRRVAIKLLRKGQDWDDESETLVERFYHEAQILRRLQHPGIIDVYDFGFEDDIGFYLIMELLQGQSLLRYMQTNTGLMPWRLLYRVLSQVCDAMGYAHKREIVHRDLKPEHIFLLGQPNDKVRVKVFDFGIARFHVEEEDERLTQQGVTLGTPRYLSPEQTMGGNIDHRSDIYTLSIILFELLTRRRVFQVDGAFQLMTHHAYIDAPSIDEARPDLDFPQALIDLVKSGLSKDPKGRPETMEDFRKALFIALREHLDPSVDEAPAVSPPVEGPLKVTGSFYLVGKDKRRREPTGPSNPGLKMVSVSTPAPQMPPSPTKGDAAALGLDDAVALDVDDIIADVQPGKGGSVTSKEDAAKPAETMLPLPHAPLTPLPPDQIGLLAPDASPPNEGKSPLSLLSLSDSSDAVSLVEEQSDGKPGSSRVKLPSQEEIESLLPPMPSFDDLANDIDILDDLDSIGADEEFSIIEDVGALGLVPPTSALLDDNIDGESRLLDDLKTDEPGADHLIDSIDMSVDHIAEEALKAAEDLISDDFEPGEMTGDTMLEAAPNLLAKSLPEDDLSSETSLEESPLAEDGEEDTLLGPAPSLSPDQPMGGPPQITGYSETQLPAVPEAAMSPNAAIKAAPRSTPAAPRSTPTAHSGSGLSAAGNPSQQNLQAAQAAMAGREAGGVAPTPRPTPRPMQSKSVRTSSSHLRSIPQIYEAPRGPAARPGPSSEEALPNIAVPSPTVPPAAHSGPFTEPSSDKWKQHSSRSPRPMIRSAVRDDVLKQGKGGSKLMLWVAIGSLLFLSACGAAIYFFVLAK